MRSFWRFLTNSLYVCINLKNILTTNYAKCITQNETKSKNFHYDMSLWLIIYFKLMNLNIMRTLIHTNLSFNPQENTLKNKPTCNSSLSSNSLLFLCKNTALKVSSTDHTFVTPTNWKFLIQVNELSNIIFEKTHGKNWKWKTKCDLKLPESKNRDNRLTVITAAIKLQVSMTNQG